MICIYECKCVVNIFYDDVYLPIFQIISLIKKKKENKNKKRFRFVEIRYTSQISVDFNYKKQYYRKTKSLVIRNKKKKCTFYLEVCECECECVSQMKTDLERERERVKVALISGYKRQYEEVLQQYDRWKAKNTNDVPFRFIYIMYIWIKREHSPLMRKRVFICNINKYIYIMYKYIYSIKSAVYIQHRTTHL